MCVFCSPNLSKAPAIAAARDAADCRVGAVQSAHRAIDQKRVGVHVEAGEPAVADLPAVREGSAHWLATGLGRARVGTEGDDAVAVDEKLLRNYREAKPVSSNRDQQLIHHLVRVAPSAAGVWKPLCLGPSKVPMEQGKNARNIAASHGVIEAPNRRKYRHDCSP